MTYVFVLSIVGLSTALIWGSRQLHKQQGKYKLLQQKLAKANQTIEEQQTKYGDLVVAQTEQTQRIQRLEVKIAASQTEVQQAEKAAQGEAEQWFEELERLERRVQDLSAENQLLTEANQVMEKQLTHVHNHPEVRDGLITLESFERDLYSQERRAIVVDVLQKSLQAMSDDTRRKHVLTDIVENNQVDSERDQLAQKIREIFRTYRKMDRRTAKGLKEIGFEIISDNNHCKIQFRHDDRYTYTFAKTPSDARAGKNNASTICRNLL